MANGGVVVELRVHGVSGTPPEAMLGARADAIQRVAGDDDAGFYRHKSEIDAAAEGHWRAELEAYSWGRLTSGPASRAVWLLFLPFIFINLAHWMQPPAVRRGAAAVAVGLLRLIALSFTLTLMLSAAVVLIDVLVWQCVGLDQCSSRLGPLSRWAALPRGVQVASGALPLMLVIVALWRLGKENTRLRGAAPDPAVTVGEVPLQRDDFWVSDPSVLRLRACHVMAWTSALGALMLVAPIRYAGSPDAHSVSIILLSANGLLLLLAVAATAWNPATARGGASADRWTPPLLWSRWISLGVLAVTVIWVAVAEVTYPAAPNHFPGLHGTIYVLFVIQCILLVAVFGCTAMCLRGGSADGASLRGFTGSFVALIGWLVACGFSVGVGLLAAQVLGTAVLSTTTAREVIADAPLIVPPPYFWAAVAIVGLIIAATIAGLGVWWWVKRRRTPEELRNVLEDYPGAQTDGRAKQVASSRGWAALTDRAPVIAAGLALFGVAEIAAMLIWYLADHAAFDSLPRRSPAITNVSVFIAAALATGLVLLTAQAYRDRGLRRVVAVLWDVVTFWPRANHPLTPPCYAERTVPELLERVRDMIGEPGTRVVLAAHSQGSLIAAATVLRAGGGIDRVALLTFGSPLRRLYATNFPAYFGADAISQLHKPWINLWAHTDPIGGWVTNDEDRSMPDALAHTDFRLLDVTSLTMRDGKYPPICGHSGFWTRPEYRGAIAALESTFVPAGSAADICATAPPTAELL